MIALIEAWTERRPARDVLAALERARVPGSAYRSTAEVAGDPVVREQALLGRVDLGLPGLERVPVGPTPVRLSAVPAVRPRRPPGIGEHNDEVYGGVLGYGRERIARLREDGVI